MNPVWSIRLSTMSANNPAHCHSLQYALTELFERRAGYMLDLESYQSIGGVTGALARRADEIFESVNEQGQEAIRQLFLRLVNVGEGNNNTRRRIRRSELSDDIFMDEVINLYGKSRLLTFDRDPETREGTIEVAHEAIIRNWERLQRWIDDSREILQIQRRLTTNLQEWEISDKDPAYLASGVRLIQFESLPDSDAVLNKQEEAFLQQSITLREEQRRAEEARKEHELELQKQAANRLRYVVAVIAVGLVVAVGLAAFSS